MSCKIYLVKILNEVRTKLSGGIQTLIIMRSTVSFLSSICKNFLWTISWVFLNIFSNFDTLIAVFNKSFQLLEYSSSDNEDKDNRSLSPSEQIDLTESPPETIGKKREFLNQNIIHKVRLQTSPYKQFTTCFEGSNRLYSHQHFFFLSLEMISRLKRGKKLPNSYLTRNLTVNFVWRIQIATSWGWPLAQVSGSHWDPRGIRWFRNEDQMTIKGEVATIRIFFFV